jgi:hypothetical protein
MSKLTALAAAALAIAASLTGHTAAEARGGKEYFVQNYTFDKPMHGYSGRAGNYMCDYQRLPNRVCVMDKNGNEKCSIKSWTLRQHCY